MRCSLRRERPATPLRQWAQELTKDQIRGGVICQAFDSADHEIAKLAIDGDGKILIVEVQADHRRRGIATAMFRRLQGNGYRVEHDWENMRDDGAVCAKSL